MTAVNRHIRVRAQIVEAASRRAAELKVTRLEFVRQALDTAAGRARLPRGQIIVIQIGDTTRPLTIRCTPVQSERWDAAAGRAGLPFGTWASIVIAAAAGVSDLPSQLRRVG